MFQGCFRIIVVPFYNLLLASTIKKHQGWVNLQLENNIGHLGNYLECQPLPNISEINTMVPPDRDLHEKPNTTNI